MSISNSNPSAKIPPAAAKSAPAYDPKKDHISTLLLELGQATAIVDLLFMVASGRAVDSVDAMQEGTLDNSLSIVLDRLYAVKAAAEAISDERRPAGLKQEVAHG
jgi:hypothetical protein